MTTAAFNLLGTEKNCVEKIHVALSVDPWINGGTGSAMVPLWYITSFQCPEIIYII